MPIPSTRSHPSSSISEPLTRGEGKSLAFLFQYLFLYWTLKPGLGFEAKEERANLDEVLTEYAYVETNEAKICLAEVTLP